MRFADSALDAQALDRARRLLAYKPKPQSVWPTLAAAAFAAACALSLAMAMVVAPPVVVDHPLAERDAR